MTPIRAYPSSIFIKPVSANPFPASTGTRKAAKLKSMPRRKGEGPLDFELARAIVRAERLKTHADWRRWCATVRKEHYPNIPTNPHKEWPAGYLKKGWVDWDDWFKEPVEGGAGGTGEVRGRRAAGRDVGGMCAPRSHWKRHET